MPTAQVIAERAGVAKRSVFHHFPDMDTLLIEAADTQAARFWGVLQTPAADLALVERIEVAVDQRARLFDAIGDVRRVAVRHEDGSAVLAGRLADSRAALRRHLDLSLGPELSALDSHVAEGVHVIGSWEAWELLRHQQGLTAESARRTVKSTIESAFGRIPI